jgi:hypothetical protein
MNGFRIVGHGAHIHHTHAPATSWICTPVFPPFCYLYTTCSGVSLCSHIFCCAIIIYPLTQTHFYSRKHDEQLLSHIFEYQIHATSFIIFFVFVMFVCEHWIHLSWKALWVALRLVLFRCICVYTERGQVVHLHHKQTFRVAFCLLLWELFASSDAFTHPILDI